MTTTADTAYLIALVLVTGGVTFVLRAFPFIAFGLGRQPPETVKYVGRVLSPAAIAMLVVYCFCCCFRNRTLPEGRFGAAELSAAAVVVLLQLKFRNPLVSIVAGTALYMVMLQKILAW